MKISRRDLLKSATVASGTVFAGTLFGKLNAEGNPELQEPKPALPLAFDRLQPLGNRVKPIRAEELQGRVAHAQQLMSDAKRRFEVLYVTPGTTLLYYTGIQWWPSERILAFLVPRQGDPLIICPAFEEGRLREQLRWSIEIRVWQEDENPYTIAGKWFAERGIRTGKFGVEETTRYIFYDGLRHTASSFEYTSGDPVTVGCRAQKTEHELDLMRLACAATLDVYKATFASLREGITQREVADLVLRGYERMGLSGQASVFFGASSALPHGSREEQVLREGIGVMIDDGTSVEGYQSDVTRMGGAGQTSGEVATCVRNRASRTRCRTSGSLRRTRMRFRGPRIAQGDYRCGVWPELQVFFAPSWPWNRNGRTRSSLPGSRQPRYLGAGNDIFE